MEIYPCRIKNERIIPVRLKDADGHLIEIVMGGQEIVLEALDEDALFGGIYEQIIFTPDWEDVKCTQRHSWAPKANKEYPWVVEVINLQGLEWETRFAGGREWTLPCGIPVFVNVSALEPWARFRRIEIKKVPETFEDKVATGFWDFRMRLEDVGTLRSEKELEALSEEIERLEGKARQKPKAL